MTIVLASASPRRRELLEMLAGSCKLIICPAQGSENPPKGAGPAETVEALARAKALEVADKRQPQPDEVIVAADTIVWYKDRIYGKPHSEEEAFDMLSCLSGQTHAVYTGVSVIHNGAELTEHECTQVTFRDLSDEEIRGYIATGEPMDKAGAYGAQGIGALLVKCIEGDFFNVMGLPVCRLGEMLKRTGVKLL